MKEKKRVKFKLVLSVWIFGSLLTGCTSKSEEGVESQIVYEYATLPETTAAKMADEETDNGKRNDEETTKAEEVETKPPKETNTKYTFHRADADLYREQQEQLESVYGSVNYSCILRLFDEEQVVCPSEVECAGTLGCIWALFGEPDDPTMYEDFYNYMIAAEDKDGNVLYLEIYQYSGMPSIGGPVGEEFGNYEEAARELATLIAKTAPADYEWSGIYEDFDVSMKYYVKNGVAGIEDGYLEAMEEYYAYEVYELDKKIEQLFQNMSTDEINQWVNEYQTIDEMIGYFEEHPEVWE